MIFREITKMVFPTLAHSHVIKILKYFELKLLEAKKSIGRIKKFIIALAYEKIMEVQNFLMIEVLSIV